jgi:ABC-type Fe3+-hydroxamate transport system substrate-binding protein
MRKAYLAFVLLILSLLVQAQEARRIISLVPWMTKSLYLMGEQKRLVGCTNYCPVEVTDKILVVATSVNVNIEKILMLRPDLVLASSLIKPEILDNIRKLGIKVENMSYPGSFDEICTDFVRIGQLVGQTEKAKNIVKQQHDRMAKIRAKVPAGKHPKMFVQIGANPLFCAVPQTFMNDFITFAGGTNIASGLKIGSVTREYVLKQNPDIIFIVTMGIVAEEERDTWKNYPVLSAAKNKRIFILDADKTCSPTPVLFVDALEEIVHLSYK